MARMNLWPTLITGLVGVAGIAGTILAARMTARNQTANLMLSISEERNRARIADKRQVYANFIASVNETILATGHAYYSETDPGERDAALIRALPERGAIYHRAGEVELIAPEEVTSQAVAMTRLVMSYSDELMKYAGKVPEAVIETLYERGSEMEKQLFKAMRADLGIEAAGPDR